MFPSLLSHWSNEILRSQTFPLKTKLLVLKIAEEKKVKRKLLSINETKKVKKKLSILEELVCSYAGFINLCLILSAISMQLTCKRDCIVYSVNSLNHIGLKPLVIRRKPQTNNDQAKSSSLCWSTVWSLLHPSAADGERCTGQISPVWHSWHFCLLPGSH